MYVFVCAFTHALCMLALWHCSLFRISVSGRCYLVLLPCFVFGVFYMSELALLLVKKKDQECSRCDSDFSSYGLVCSVISPC